MTVLGIFIGCIAALVIMLAIYGVLTVVKKNKTTSAVPQTKTTVTETTASTASTAPTETAPDVQETVTEEPSELSGDSSMVFKVGGSAQTEQGSEYTGLYQLDQKSPLYIVPDDEEETVDLSSSPDLYTRGYYTGRPYKEDSTYIEIDYRDGKALVPAENAKADSSAVIMPVGMVCQVTEGYVGYSGSAPACLHMMQRQTGITPFMPELSDYSQLLSYAQDHGYSDQGSLYLYGGGMTADAVVNFAQDIYSVKLENVYDETKKPSETVKPLLEKGIQVMALTRFENGDIAEKGSTEHYILLTGYTEKNGYPEFIYANAYRDSNVELGYPLKAADADTLDACATGTFRDKPALLCIAK